MGNAWLTGAAACIHATVPIASFLCVYIVMDLLKALLGGSPVGTL
jgi:hypothetical protein